MTPKISNGFTFLESIRAQRSGARNQQSGNRYRKIDNLIDYDYPASPRLRRASEHEHDSQKHPAQLSLINNRVIIYHRSLEVNRLIFSKIVINSATADDTL